MVTYLSDKLPDLKGWGGMWGDKGPFGRCVMVRNGELWVLSADPADCNGDIPDWINDESRREIVQAIENTRPID